MYRGKKDRAIEIRVGTMNVRSARNKIEQIVEMIKGNEIDMIGLTETWFDDESAFEMKNILEKEDYRIEFSNRGRRKGGGICLCYKKQWERSTLRYVEDIGLAVGLRRKGETIKIIVVYIPNPDKPEITNKFDEFIEEEVERARGMKVIVMGDLNIPIDTERKHRGDRGFRRYYKWEDKFELMGMTVVNGRLGEESGRKTRFPDRQGDRSKP